MASVSHHHHHQSSLEGSVDSYLCADIQPISQLDRTVILELRARVVCDSPVEEED